MRLHHLELQAFGPFADRQQVDFDALSSQGLFLLNGPTGAGKSSVLDAVCFALYGSVPGVRQGAKRLRSDHAAASVAPEVMLEFSTADRRFRVTRSPAWERPSRRGSGTTTEQARTLLSELVGTRWVDRSTRNDEAGLALQSVLGMDKEQFTKVVMLPQGEFAAFLRADATSRRELLQRLFSTTRFEDLERLFAEQSLRLSRDVAEQEGRLDRLLQRAVDEAERHGLATDAETVSTDVDSPTDRAASMDALVAAVRSRRDTVAEEHMALQEQSVLADGALASLCGRRTRHGLLSSLRQQQREQDQQAAGIATMSEALRRHDRAQSLAADLRLDEEMRAGVEHAAAAHAAALERTRDNGTALKYLEADPAGPGAPELSGEALTGACAASAAALAVLRAALPDEQRLLGIRSEIRTLGSSIDDLDDRVRDTTEALALVQRRRASDLDSLVPLRRAAEGVPRLRAERDAATAAEQAVQDHRSAQLRRTAADERFREASEHFLTLKQHWLSILQRRLEQAADELAEHLVDGEPCPVCGSPDHPDPVSSSGGERVTLDQEQSARRDQDDAEAAMHAARDVRESVLLQLAEFGAAIGELTPEQAAEATRAAERRLDEAEAADARSAVVEENVERLTQEAEQRAAEVEDLRERRNDAGSRRSSLQELEAELELRRAGLLAGAPSLAHRIEDVQGASEDLAALRYAEETLSRARADHAASRRRLEEALRETLFDSVDEARTALLAVEHRDRIERSIREHEVTGHRLDAAWDDDAVREALAEEQAGLRAPTDEEERVAADSADDQRARAQQAGISAEVLAHSVTQLEAYSRRLADLERAVGPLRERARLVSAVAETARGAGENAYRMPLATYVLASRLEQVAAAATERLVEMSDGRYQLVHSDARAGNRRSGLGLNVIDGWTGSRRDTSTLSGGESFMASLALALGLADVVQQEAGGLDIETLFIDEGFGSLDEQALEQVMDALEGLRSGGRVVGLVSHVPEMKQRIGAQLQVVKGRQGSVLRLVDEPARV
ncbi:AAA family ATPase [Arthrobacter echini]|uniref:AAA family ATPase n=1 Tax=Arthrobacter echini TaxID=1529066 RepID=UPI001455E83D|nr:SMC family ATPase [Arthrobacter echini]